MALGPSEHTGTSTEGPRAIGIPICPESSKTHIIWPVFFPRLIRDAPDQTGKKNPRWAFPFPRPGECQTGKSYPGKKGTPARVFFSPFDPGVSNGENQTGKKKP